MRRLKTRFGKKKSGISLGRSIAFENFQAEEEADDAEDAAEDAADDAEDEAEEADED